MFHSPEFSTEFCVFLSMSRFYKNWDPDEPDAAHDMALALKSITSVGIKPSRVEIDWNYAIKLYFSTATGADECYKAVNKVLDLLWLVL